jgi:hypothetical protein
MLFAIDLDKQGCRSHPTDTAKLRYAEVVCRVSQKLLLYEGLNGMDVGQ